MHHSLKYGLYMLANAPITLKNEYPIIRRMVAEDKRDRVQLRKKLCLSLVQMFPWLITEIEETIEAKQRPWKCPIVWIDRYRTWVGRWGRLRQRTSCYDPRAIVQRQEDSDDTFILQLQPQSAESPAEFGARR